MSPQPLTLTDPSECQETFTFQFNNLKQHSVPEWHKSPHQSMHWGVKWQVVSYTLCHYDRVSQMSNSTSWCCRYSLTTTNKTYVGSKWQSTHTNMSSYTQTVQQTSQSFTALVDKKSQRLVTPTCDYHWRVTHLIQSRHKSWDFHMYPAHIRGIWVRHWDMSVRSVSLCVTVCRVSCLWSSRKGLVAAVTVAYQASVWMDSGHSPVNN